VKLDHARMCLAEAGFFTEAKRLAPAGPGERVEHLAIRQLVLRLAVEGFDLPFLPRAGLLDVDAACTHAGNPPLHSLGDELWPSVRADMCRRPLREEQAGQHVDHVRRDQPPRHADCRGRDQEAGEDRQEGRYPPHPRRQRGVRHALWGCSAGSSPMPSASGCSPRTRRGGADAERAPAAAPGTCGRPSCAVCGAVRAQPCLRARRLPCGEAARRLVELANRRAHRVFAGPTNGVARFRPDLAK